MNLKFDQEQLQIIQDDSQNLFVIAGAGCGKSTILRLISGLEEITSGEILIDGKVVNNIHPKDRDIAFVFQSYALYPHLSVFDNMAFPLKIRGEDKKTIQSKVIEKAELLGLSELLKITDNDERIVKFMKALERVNSDSLIRNYISEENDIKFINNSMMDERIKKGRYT